MPYHVKVLPHAERSFRKLKKTHSRLCKEIQSYILNDLPNDPRPHGHKKLSVGGYRIRFGDYRLLYNIDDDAKTVYIADVLHRSDAYRFL
ncbi:MAG: type II toxin-antitoxin system RelE/ParE family toxin [Planctomycetes bacterium]|nr:type II toxin-antitoxin system RelE/ParE family toxin [Planctomycetota bacterium]NUQ35647.1 type II toxin-antitoxin system RelE/ParE family toxin [Planctomycetaceae bacterium]